MVSRHDEGRRIQSREPREERVDLFDGGDLALEVSVMAVGIGVLEVHEDEVVVGGDTLDERGRILGGRGHVRDRHPRQPGDPPVHRVLGTAGRPESVAVQIGRIGLVAGEASGEEAVRDRFVGEDVAYLLQQALNHVRGASTFLARGPDRVGRQPGALGVGVLELCEESLTPEHQDDTMLLLRDEVDLHAIGSFDPFVDPIDHPACLFVGGSPGPSVRHRPVLGEGGEVEPGRDITRRQLEADAQRAQHAAADQLLDRVVAEEGEVCRPAAGRDPLPDRAEKPDRALRGQSVQVGRPRRLQLGAPGVGVRQPTESVQNHEDDLRTAFGPDRELVGELHRDHLSRSERRGFGNRPAGHRTEI